MRQHTTLMLPGSYTCNLVSHTEGTNLKNVTDNKGMQAQCGTHRPRMQRHSGGVVPVALGLGDIYSPGLTDE
ncbi:hypothetical protein PAMP_014779 [Pampus punctatissimus]